MSEAKRFPCHEELIYPLVLAGCFEIDIAGRVWRLSDRRGTNPPPVRRRAEARRRSGHLVVRCHLGGGKRVHAAAHRLVYRYFFGPIPDGLTINHLNGVRDDNRPENLEPATYSEQMRHAVDVLGKPSCPGEKNGRALVRADDVRRIRRLCVEPGHRRTLADELGVSLSTIAAIVRRRNWAHVE